MSTCLSTSFSLVLVMPVCKRIFTHFYSAYRIECGFSLLLKTSVSRLLKPFFRLPRSISDLYLDQREIYQILLLASIISSIFICRQNKFPKSLSLPMRPVFSLFLGGFHSPNVRKIQLYGICFVSDFLVTYFVVIVMLVVLGLVLTKL